MSAYFFSSSRIDSRGRCHGRDRRCDCGGLRAARFRFLNVEQFGTILAMQDKALLVGAWLRDNLKTAYFSLAIDEGLPVIIWATDDAGNIIFVNQHWLNFTGQNLKDVLGGHNWTRSIHPEDADAACKIFEKALKTREPVTNHYRLKRHDGVYRYIHARAEPRVNALGYIGFALDVTDLLPLVILVDKRSTGQESSERRPCALPES
jgi:PAS domain S-box-containing protein